MTSTHGSLHLDDGDLVRFLSGEITGAEAPAVADHLDRCDDCARRLEGWREEAAAVTRLLEDMPVPAMDPARRQRSLAAVRQTVVRDVVTAPAAGVTRRRWLAWSSPGALARAAAVAALLVAGGLTASPAGSWIADRWRGFVDREPAATEPAPTTVAASSSVVAFRPAGSDMVLELATPQEQGSLTLWIRNTPTASARITGGEGEMDVVVLPGSLRIANHESAAADYEVTIPARLRTLKVRVGDGPERVLRPSELGDGWSIVIGLRHGKVEEPGTGL